MGAAVKNPEVVFRWDEERKTYIDSSVPVGVETPYWILQTNEIEAGRSIRSMAKTGELIDYWRRNRAGGSSGSPSAEKTTN